MISYGRPANPQKRTPLRTANTGVNSEPGPAIVGIVGIVAGSNLAPHVVAALEARKRG